MIRYTITNSKMRQTLVEMGLDIRMGLAYVKAMGWHPILVAMRFENVKDFLLYMEDGERGVTFKNDDNWQMWVECYLDVLKHKELTRNNDLFKEWIEEGELYSE